MIILGLTGSIGMGKSTVAAMFADEGIPVFDADAVVHRLQDEGGALVDPIERLFPGTTGAAGVERQLLARRVLEDPESLARLEGLIHPVVASERSRFLEEHEASDIVLLDIPLLFEKGGAELVDRIIVVSAPAEVQRARVLARPGMSPEKLDRILALQMPDETKRARADFVIDTSTPLGETRDSVRRILACLRAGRDS